MTNMSEKLTSTGLSPSPPAPDANFGYLFRLAHQRFRVLLDGELAGLGLSGQEYGILSVFETRAELTTAELARVAQVTRQTMHAAVRSLEAAGLVERRARNRRVVLMSLTARGRRCLDAATHRVHAVEDAAFAGLSHEDQRTVRAWLATLAASTPSVGVRQKETP
jgi:DNA-binding MarR family transcriptional regulator